MPKAKRPNPAPSAVPRPAPAHITRDAAIAGRAAQLDEVRTLDVRPPTRPVPTPGQTKPER